MIQLENIGKGNDDKARLANQLLGNLLYNTSVLGYFRELFVMDVDNSNGPKFQFGNERLKETIIGTKMAGFSQPVYEVI